MKNVHGVLCRRMERREKKPTPEPQPEPEIKKKYQKYRNCGDAERIDANANENAFISQF